MVVAVPRKGEVLVTAVEEEKQEVTNICGAGLLNLTQTDMVNTVLKDHKKPLTNSAL